MVDNAADPVSTQVSNMSQQYAPVPSDGVYQDYQGGYPQDGFSSFMSQATNNPMNMGGNFLNNLMSGNVSTMSMAAMIASSFMIFGRFGLFTKLLGALLGMHTIGRNSQPAYSYRTQPMTRQTAPVSEQVAPTYEPEVVERNRGIGR